MDTRVSPRSRPVRIVTSMLMVLALALGLVATAPAAESHAAPGYVSTTYTKPKKGQSNAGVTALQQRLVKAKVLESRYVTGYYGDLTAKAVKKFQKSQKFKQTGKVGPGTWKRLVKVTGQIKITKKKATAAKKKTTVVKGIDSRCLKGKAICVDKTSSKLRWMVDGKVKMTMDARFGGPGHRTREGSFKVFMKSYNHTSTIYNTWMPRAMFFSGGQAVHYSPDFAARGYNGASHGCVNVRNWSKINSLYKQVKVGTKVVVYRS